MYKITIEKITTETKKETEWVRLHDRENYDDDKNPKYGYRSKEVTEDIYKEIYSQTLDRQLDIKPVIDAFNQ